MDIPFLLLEGILLDVGFWTLMYYFFVIFWVFFPSLVSFFFWNVFGYWLGWIVQIEWKI
jgi:hypothetical protein